MTDTTLNRFISSGTDAEMNAHVPDPATPASGPDYGYFWFNTDDQLTYSYDFVGMVWVAPAGSGTVTSVSVTTANGVSGTVATSTTTPAITIAPDLLNHAACGGI